MKKYYEAYDKRYRQVHEKGLSWTTEGNTPIVEEMICKYKLNACRMLEIGCGEGRDVRYLLEKGYDVKAVDVSSEAIDYCIRKDPQHKEQYRIEDILTDTGNKEKYGFIYSVACLHMLVEDEDRRDFYRYIYDHLEEEGYALVLSMGDGRREIQSEITEAFDDVKRVHQESAEEVWVAATSCRIVNSDRFKREALDNGFDILEYGMTEIEKHFDQMMYIIIKKH
ncbi:MAG: class I SAM-dependent methyltransferase [Erysipelotrichaceae bacterium]|nr:class I SAM-dependent methyltransferase [Erysipelotrichaceae bacterium]